jgi:hypothetical protein
VYYDGSWQVFGGTSAASPLVAGIFTLLGLNKQSPQFAWTHTNDFHDVTSGSNWALFGADCNTVVCNAAPGWDGPTGWGTPNGSKLANGGGPGSSSGGGSSSGSSGGSSSGANGTCKHGVCTAGAPVTSTCSWCASDVCRVDPYCCAYAWDSICVGEVYNYCNGVTCP